jgi:hypothetical protein
VFLSLRRYDPVVARANRRVRCGATDAAAAELRAAMEVKPTADRANALACALVAKQQSTEAYKYLLEAKERGLHPSVVRNNAAVVLRGMGRPEEVLAVLEPDVLTRMAIPHEVITYCHALIDLNRRDAAWDQIQRLEQTFRSLPPSQARVLRPRIDECRDRFEAVGPVKKAGGLDEL